MKAAIAEGGAMKRSLEPDERNMPNPPGEQLTNAGADQHDIDQILADSFPASDAPPWTLGVAPTPAEHSQAARKTAHGDGEVSM